MGNALARLTPAAVETWTADGKIRRDALRAAGFDSGLILEGGSAAQPVRA